MNDIHVSITADRLMEAVESGEYIGFCKACGSEQGGCEPDARNYECESCGEIAVDGVEELLFRT